MTLPARSLKRPAKSLIINIERTQVNLIASAISTKSSNSTIYHSTRSTFSLHMKIEDDVTSQAILGEDESIVPSASHSAYHHRQVVVSGAAVQGVVAVPP